MGCLLFFLVVTSPFDTPARAHYQHTHNWTVGDPLEQPYIWFEKEYLRCGDVTALYVASIMDYDQCTNPGCSFPNGWAQDSVKLVSWSDNGAGGEFGYLGAQGNFVPSGNVNQITHYKASDTNPRTVHITLTVDDEPLWANDPPTTNPQNIGNLTVWEFTISNGAAGFRPWFDVDVPPFTATIRPATDHMGFSMAEFITFWLYDSREPGYCLNATRERDPRQWDDTYPDDNDLKFPPGQAGFYISAPYWDPNPLNYTRAQTNNAVLTATVTVRCLDYGAHGQIDATADFPYGMESARLEGTVPPNAKYGAQIPIDENPQNYIYDGSPLNDGPAAEDEDTTPANQLPPANQPRPGDGLSRYEEYRGFMINGAWTELNPTVKDVFIYNPQGLDLAGFAILGLRIHQIRQGEFDAVFDVPTDNDVLWVPGGDGRVDEDPYDGMDNDGDGRFDEDPADTEYPIND